MSSSKAYQTVVAGRVREDDLPFFRNNLVPTISGRLAQFRPSSVRKEPVGRPDFLNTDNAGKATDRDVSWPNSYTGDGTNS